MIYLNVICMIAITSLQICVVHMLYMKALTNFSRRNSRKDIRPLFQGRRHGETFEIGDF